MKKPKPKPIKKPRYSAPSTSNITATRGVIGAAIEAVLDMINVTNCNN